jgi:hypothetical protein
MADSDFAVLDGERVQRQLGGGGRSYRCTSLTLIAMSRGAFVVVTGTDTTEKTFTDDDIAEIFEVFDTTVADHGEIGADALRDKVVSAIGQRWKICDLSKDCECSDCPFDLMIKMSTRIVFHLQIPGWSFEEARIKIKSGAPETQFSDLEWLSLNGQSQKPHSFSIIDQDTDKEHYQFGLFARVDQAQGWTRVIIDPEVMNDGLGP